MFCKNCGKKLNETASFCSGCGSKIDNKNLEVANEDILKYLTKEEQTELNVLDDTRITSLSSSWNPLASSLFGSKISKAHRKRIINLRTKARMKKRGLEESKDKEEISKIREEEEKRIKDRF